MRSIVSLWEATLALGGMQTQRDLLLMTKFGKNTLGLSQTKEAFIKKSCDDFEDLQIVLGDATTTGKHSLGLGEETDAKTFVVEDRQGGTEEDE
ncbi:hypothetical protein C1H46_005510 [Malus baccata]|uniref:Uncharacterized protein n=1 Tax=Malus baccata TaxID=106549 RepID=A0A540NCZ4_MALBA|nr:hypothetical protein C1H46_005510 [Malus baccata]